MNNLDLFVYKIEGAMGTVLAVTKEEAENKVRRAYARHDTAYSPCWEVLVFAVDEMDGWFCDCPDVLELIEE